MKKYLVLLSVLLITGCRESSEDNTTTGDLQDTISIVKEREYKILDSRFINNEALWAPFQNELEVFSEGRYSELSQVIMDKDIPGLQNSVENGDFSYEELVLFYLYRIRKFDRENDLSLNSVISLNPDILEEARAKDKELQAGGEKHPIFGIPVLLKDNINTGNMATTAGAVILENNFTQNAFIVDRLQENGALILGKANLSEWAYFFCGECPSGYSAIGGQTLNPYGRKIFDTGGSSSGSAVAVAANFAPAAVGSETAGSVLSPSSLNSVVGLKPTIGVLSRGGIIPISSTLDTPGPITKNVMDNAILLSAMTGRDKRDHATANNPEVVTDYFSDLKITDVKTKRFGAIKSLMTDPLYTQAVADLRSAGAEVIEFEAEDINLPNFLNLLNLDMKKDLPVYFAEYGGNLEVGSVKDVVIFNYMDTLARAPYGQALFEGILNEAGGEESYAAIKDTLSRNGKQFFEVPMIKFDLDAVLSINNYHAAFAAVAQYPAITVPMGYTEEKTPSGLTFIARPYREADLYKWAYSYEQLTKKGSLQKIIISNARQKKS